MKFLLAAINAKYIHSNLGVFSLKRFAEQELNGGVRCGGEQDPEGTGLPAWDPPVIEIGEYTINNQMELILEDIYIRKPDVVGFSCYIWNIVYVRELVRDLHKVLPDTDIWLGGPEVSYDAEAVLTENQDVTGIMMGEGEVVFAALVQAYASERAGPDTWQNTAGLAFRDHLGGICVNQVRPVMNMDRIPFSYGDMRGFEHRIVYYESSRGCPFSCSYCLSSIDKSVRFRDPELVMTELAFFLERKVKQVKFVDRTFNCKKSHAMAIWNYIREHDNGVTNFHFEISADLLDEEEIALIGSLRPGLIQLEIGVQTTNLKTIAEIRRKTDLKRLAEVVRIINEGRNVHQHLDLIAGLPYEDYASFRQSFCDVYAMRPEQLQLGFLKVLKGSHMEAMASRYGLLYRAAPPYEVLSTKWLDFEEVLKLKAVEDMVEVYYNSRQFVQTLEFLEYEFANAFDMFEALAEYYRKQSLGGLKHSRLARYEILYEWLAKRYPQRRYQYADRLMEDLYLRENIKSRPHFAGEQQSFKQTIRDLVPGLRELGTQIHVEVFRDGSIRLFDYRQRDPLTYNAYVKVLRQPEKEQPIGDQI